MDGSSAEALLCLPDDARTPRALATPPGVDHPPGQQAGRSAVLELVRGVARVMVPRFVALTSAVNGLGLTRQHTGARVLTHLADHVLLTPGSTFGHSPTVRPLCQLACCA